MKERTLVYFIHTAHIIATLSPGITLYVSEYDLEMHMNSDKAFLDSHITIRNKS